MKKIALIVAGGSGSRMNASIPKQFIGIHGIPVLMHTFHAFLRSDPRFEFILVLPETEISTWKELCRTHTFQVPHKIVPGGKTRFHSVKNGLAQTEEEGIVFIHDGVRPLVSPSTIEHCFLMARKKGNALPVIAPSESVREISPGANRAVDRNKYVLVQTPQTFQAALIKKAYRTPYEEKFTDDASVLENSGVPIHLVEGNRENIKITWPEDILLAEAFLSITRD